MTVLCQLTNYKEDGSPFDNPKVIVEDDGKLSNKVRISIGEETATVCADELEKAINACRRLPF